MSIYKTYGVLWFGAVVFWILAFFTAGIYRLTAEITGSTLLILSFVFQEKTKKMEVSRR